MSDQPDPPKITLTLDVLTALYDDALVEIVHGIADAERVLVRVTLGGNREPIDLKLPDGDYLLLKMTSLPTTRRGIFAVQCPAQPRGQPRGHV